MCIFAVLEGWNWTNWQNSEPLKLQKRQFYIRFYVKSDWQKNPEISTLWDEIDKWLKNLSISVWFHVKTVQIPENWFHVKSEWQKNAEISTLWLIKKYFPWNQPKVRKLISRNISALRIRTDGKTTFLTKLLLLIFWPFRQIIFSEPTFLINFVKTICYAMPGSHVRVHPGSVSIFRLWTKWGLVKGLIIVEIKQIIQSPKYGKKEVLEFSLSKIDFT